MKMMGVLIMTTIVKIMILILMMTTVVKLMNLMLVMTTVMMGTTAVMRWKWTIIIAGKDATMTMVMAMTK